MKLEYGLDHKLPYPKGQVFSWLCDFARFAAFHPLMEKVDRIDSVHFKTYEFALIPLLGKIRFNYLVEVEARSSTAEIFYRGKPQGIKMAMHFLLESDAEGLCTLVKEKVQIEGFALAAVLAGRAVRKSHLATFESYGKSPGIMATPA